MAAQSQDGGWGWGLGWIAERHKRTFRMLEALYILMVVDSWVYIIVKIQ